MNATSGDNTKADKANETPVVDLPKDTSGVQMLSLRRDGTADEHNPEFIGDLEATREATREQFSQQAVSLADQTRAQSVPMMTVDDKGTMKPASEAPQDPSIKAAQEEHQKVADAARKAADAAVDALASQGTKDAAKDAGKAN